MKVSNASAQTTLRHSTAASQGDRAPTSASSLGLRVTDGGGTIVYPVRVMNFRGANVVDLGSAEIDVLIRGTGTNFTNDAGSTLAYGAVVVVDSSSNLVTTTTAQNTSPVGIVQRSTDDTNPAPVVFSGYVAQINTTGTVNALDFLETSTSAGLAQSSGTTRRVGSFAQALAAGPNPPAIMWSPPDAITGTGSGSGGVAGFLALLNYGTSGSYTTTTTFADMDATNLAVAFIAPTTGRVMIRLTCQAYNSAANSGALYWGLRESTTNVTAITQVGSADGLNAGGTVFVISRTFVVTGLTPASSHTYKWAARHATNSWVMRWDNTDLNYGYATMEVVAAP